MIFNDEGVYIIRQGERDNEGFQLFPEDMTNFWNIKFANFHAFIHTTRALGKVMINSRFEKIGEKTYQSIGYENAASIMEVRK